MTSWKWRLRFRVPTSSGLSIDEPSTELNDLPIVGAARLDVWPRGSGSIRQADWLLLSGTSNSSDEAERHGIAASQALLRAFSRLRLAADFGTRSFPAGGLGRTTRAVYEEATGRPVRDDQHGLMVYEAEPAPRFESAFALVATQRAQPARLLRALQSALAEPEEVTDKESIAYDLFAASFFDTSPDSRLVSLVSAIETVIELPSRRQEARTHVEAMIDATEAATHLTSTERCSLVSSLRWLLSESISATGHDFLSKRLGERKYGDVTAPDLWKKAYKLRSRLVHGSKSRPSRNKVEQCASSLELVVAHVLAGRLLSVDI